MIDRRRPAGLPRPARAGAHRAPRHRSRRRLLWGSAAVAVAALVAALVLVPGTADQPSGGGAPGPATGAAPAPAAAALVRWARGELPAGTSVAVPPDLLADVVAAGGTDDRFGEPGEDRRLRLTTTDPPEGARVLARFSDGPDAAWTVIDPRPGRPTADELARRQRLAAAVLANPGSGAGGRAADVLTRGHVDPRLLGLLAVLVTQLGVGIADLPPAPAEPEGPPQDAPLVRTALIDRVGTERVGTGRPATERLLAFLAAQRPPYAPDRVEVTDEGVRIAFRYDSDPDALVTASTP